MQPRTLTVADGVEFTITIEADDSPVRGHYATDDADLDRAQEDEIMARADRGEVEAWCGVIVTAEWRGFKASDSIWACSLDSEYTVDVVVREHGMKAEALIALNQTIADTVGNLEPLLAV